MDYLSIHPLTTPTHRDRNAQTQIDNSFWNTTVQLGQDNNLPPAHRTTLLATQHAEEAEEMKQAIIGARVL